MAKKTPKQKSLADLVPTDKPNIFIMNATRKREKFIPFKPEQTCRKCGCHEQMACFHADHGPCWWVTKDMCSHCQLEEKGLVGQGEVIRPWLEKRADQDTVGKEMMRGRMT